MKSFRQQMADLSYEIDGDIDHGECFYEKEMLDDFIKNLDKMKELAYAYFKENEIKDEDESK
jgi:hypothetical protein